MSDPTIPVESIDAYWQTMKQHSEQQQKTDSLRSSVSFGATQNPDEYARLLRQAAVTGIAPSLAKDFQPEVKQAETMQAFDFDHFVASAPKLSRWASNPDNAAVSVDDLNHLAQIEASANASSMAHLSASQRQAVIEERKRVYLYNAPRNEATSAAANLNTGFYSPFINFGANVVKLLDTLAGTASEGVNIATGQHGYDPGMAIIKQLWTNGDNGVGDKALQGAEAANRFLPDKAKQGPQQWLTDADGNKFENPDYKWYGRGTVNSLESIPGAIAGFMVGGEVGGPKFMPTVMGVNAASEKYREAIRQGADIPTALTEGIGSGALNYALMTQLPAPIQTTTRTGALVQALGRGATLGAGMTYGENLLARMHDQDRTLFEGLGPNLVSMIAFETAGTIPHMIEMAEQSKLRARSTEKFAEAVGGMLKDSGAENVYIPVDRFDVFFQNANINPEQMAAKLGITEQYVEAKQGIGGDKVAIPTKEFLSQLSSDHQAQLVPDITLNPADKTMREQVQQAEQLKQFIAEGGQEKLQALTAQADAETQAAPEYQQVKAQLRQSYIDAGETEAIADNYATLQANVYANLARETGMKPTELLSLYRPVMKIGEVTEGSLPAFQDDFSKWMSERSEAESVPRGTYDANQDGQVSHGERAMEVLKRMKMTDVQEVPYTDPRNGKAMITFNAPELGTTLTRYAEELDTPEKIHEVLRAKHEEMRKAQERKYFERIQQTLFQGREPIRVDYDEQGNITDGDGRHRVIAALERGDPYIEVQTKMRDGSVQALKVDPDVVAKKLGVTPESLRTTDAQQSEFFKTLYQEATPAKEQPRGWFRVLSDGTFEIGKTKIGDFSTFIHEPAHGYMQMLSELVKRDGASETLKGDYAKILDFLGAKDGEPLTREQQETWARANEQYIREGKAPSNSLKGVFQRFAVWLSTIYKRASDLGVELSDDIRGVFDRMYAAEEGVNRAESESGPKLFTNPKEAGWTPEQFQAYAEAKGVEVEQAKAEILKQLNEAAIRERTDAWREEESNTREAVTEEIDHKPEYTAIRSLRKGALDDGTELTLNKEALVKQFGEARIKELQKQHPALYRNEGGTDPETAAEILGYNSAEEMLKALETAPRRSQSIEQATRDYMTAKHGDIRYDGTLDDQARIALENDQKASRLHREITDLQKKLDAAKETKSEQQSAVRAIKIAPLEQFRQAAKVIVEGKSLLDLQPVRYLDASRKASREAFDALRKGDVEEASAAKQRELINHFLFREAVKAKQEAEKTYKYVGSYSKNAVREKIAQAGGEQGQHAYLDQIDNILESFRFIKESNKSIQQRRQTLEQFAQQKQAEAEARFYSLNPDWQSNHPGETPDIPQQVDTAIASLSKNYRELTITELRAVKDALKNVETLALNEYTILRYGKRVSLAQEVADFERIARENNTATPVVRSGSKLSGKEKVIQSIHGLDAYMQKMEWLIDRLDGGDVNGPARRNIKKPIDDAWGDSLKMGDEIFGKLKQLIDARPKQDVSDLEESTGVQFPYFDRPLNRRQLISWALNLGTEENQKVALIGEGLMNGDGSLKPEVHQALNSLRKSELEFIQGVWDILDGMLPAVKEKALRTTGIEPKLKKVVSFEVIPSDGNGEKVTMRGGYYPLKSEPGDRVGMKQNDPSNLTAIGYQKPKTSTSHLQQVTGATYRLQLDYQNVLSKHLADVINDTTKGEAIAQVYKFISDEGVRTTLRETLGEAESREFLTWLQDFSGNNKSGAYDSSPLLDYLMSRRSGMVVARLGGNLGSYLIQMGDVFKSLADPDIKTKYLSKAFLDIRRNPTKMIEEIRSLSPNEMRFREKNFNRDIRDMLTEKSPFDQKKQMVTEFLMEGFAVMDRLVTFPAWLARYRQGMELHGNETQAIMEADRAIARDYQAGDVRNMSRMMRQGGWTRLLTTFQGDANTWYGIISASVRSGNPRAISIGLLALIAEQIVGQYIKNRGPKDDDSWPGWMIEQTLLSGLSKIPVFGDVAQYGLSKLTGQYASLQNPTMQAIEKTATAPGSIYSYSQDKKDIQEMLQDLTEATGIYVGIPGTSQAVRMWKYVHNVQKGKEPSPQGPIEAVRGALMGSNKKH